MKKNRLFKITSTLVILVMIMGTLISCANEVDPKEGDTYAFFASSFDTRPIVCLGDSITAGYQGGATVASLAFPAQLAAKLKVKVINAGVTGNTSAQGLARVPAAVFENNPQAVLIQLGANDYNNATTLAVANTATLDTLKTNLQTIIDMVRADGRKIYLVNEYGVSDTNIDSILANKKTGANGPNWTSVTDAELQASFVLYRDMQKALIVANPDIEYIENPWRGVFGVSTLMYDNLHPTYKGYEMIADNVFEDMESWLIENDLVK
jgi:acyl-CoA thioesterase-1